MTVLIISTIYVEQQFQKLLYKDCVVSDCEQNDFLVPPDLLNMFIECSLKNSKEGDGSLHKEFLISPPSLPQLRECLDCIIILLQ